LNARSGPAAIVPDGGEAAAPVAARPDRRERRPGAPLLVVCGVPAAGKSTLAAALARTTGLPVVSSRAARAGAAPDLARRDPARYSAAVYTRLGRLAVVAVGRHGGAIIDASFRRATDRPAFARGLGPCPAAALFVECRAPSEVLDERGRRGARRGHPVDPDRHSFAPLDDIAPGRRLGVSSNRPVTLLTDIVTSFIRAAEPPRSDPTASLTPVVRPPESRATERHIHDACAPPAGERPPTDPPVSLVSSARGEPAVG
jgi:predicted kinase